MIPIKLELKNFLSYGDPFVKVEFDNHNLICLSGKNGNGKSALLDAITWVLWGQARKISGTIKADAGLIRLGQTRMIVALEFLCNGQKYRVRREYSKTYGKPYVALNIDVFSESSKSYRPLIEKTIKNTQEKIEKIVGLDFNTFVNSAFLRQGQSNEFSQKTPKERKQILANILGLSKYDELSKLSLDNKKKYNENLKVLQKIQEQTNLELQQEKTCVDQLKNQKKELKSIEKELDSVNKDLEKKEKEKISVLQKKYEYNQIDQELKKLQKFVEEKKSQLLEYIALWRKIHATFLCAPDFDNFEKNRKKLFEKDKTLREQQQQEIALQEQIVVKKTNYQEYINSLEKTFLNNISNQKLECGKLELSYKNLANQVKEKRDTCLINLEKQNKISKELEIIKKELHDNKTFKENFETIKSQFEKRRVFYKALIQRGNWWQEELKSLDRKKKLVKDKQNPSCPLCEQVLTVKRKQFLARTLAGQEHFLQSRLARVKKLLKTLKLLLFEQHQEVQKLSFQNDRYKQLLANSQSLEKTLQELKSDHKRYSVELDLHSVREKSEIKKLELLKKELSKQQKEKDNLIKKDKMAIDFEKELQNLEKKRKSLKYDKKEHEGIAKELADFEKLLQKLQDLKTQKAQQEERRRVISNICAEIKNIKQQTKELEEKKRGFDSAQEKIIENNIIELKEKHKKISKEKEKYLQEIGKLQNTKSRFATLKKDQKNREKEIEIISEQSKEYQVLARVFGKDGIQALLIEQTIPEIEQEANVLLSRLTDNKSQIFIESLRDLKKGGVKESLDIHISDAFGIRPYEMFSGGEAFRIDFALRIAISKLLARRAGTALQTLIIDEGFGSQDEEGLQRLMDAIYAIQKDFVKIIVVSHLPIFKNNFPVHFVVEKDSLGSFVRVEERG